MISEMIKKPHPLHRPTKALVLLSGGQDSGTCLAYALTRYDYVETIGFFYGQRHAIELHCRDVLREAMSQAKFRKAELGPDIVLNIEPGLSAIGGTGLTADIEIKMSETGLPNTFVPGRNLLFLTYAAAYAYRRDITALVAGVCEMDYAGYPDCRGETIDAVHRALMLGMDRAISIDTPLLRLTKAETWALAQSIGGHDLVHLLREASHTCYRGVHDQLHEWGYGCGECPACVTRANGWNEYQQNLQTEQAPA